MAGPKIEKRIADFSPALPLCLCTIVQIYLRIATIAATFHSTSRVSSSAFIFPFHLYCSNIYERIELAYLHMLDDLRIRSS